MKAKSIKGLSPETILDKLNKCMQDGFNPTLAIVFLSVKQDRRSLCNLLESRGIDVFGATTAGEFTDGQIESGSIVILLLDIKKSFYQIYFQDYNGKDPREVAKGMGEKSLKEINNPAFIVVSSGLYLDGEKIIRGLEGASGEDSNIWGGKAGDDNLGKNSFVFTKSQSSPEGIILLAIDNDIYSVKGQAESGWKAVGTPKTITKSDGLWIYTLDDEPALDLMVKYMGYKFRGEGGYDITYDPDVTSPLLLLRGKGEPILRSQAFINWGDKSIMLSGKFESNAKIRFTLPPDFEVTDEVVKNTAKFKESENLNPDAMIMFSCSGRLTELGPLIGQEIDGIKNTLGSPMVGFFTYGEYGRATNGNNEYHNYTCCWVAIGENK